MNINILKFGLLVIIATSVMTLFYACSDDNGFGNTIANTNFTQMESFSFNSSITNQTKLVVDAVNGDIKVGLSSGSGLFIDGVKKVSSDSDQDALNYLEKLRVTYEPAGNIIFLTTSQPVNNGGRNLVVDFNISVPNGFIIEISEANGEIILDSLNADTDIQLANGKIELNNFYGNLNAEVSNGTINGFMTIPIDGQCYLEVLNGTIDLGIPTVTSASFLATIMNGIISVNNLTMQNMVNSQQIVSGILSAGQGSIELNVQNGIIQVNGF